MIAPVPPDEEHTTTKLGRALREADAPAAMIARAERGYYHDYLSPLALPELGLVTELRRVAGEPGRRSLSRAALLAVAEAVIDGQFDASKAESDAWARSPEGRETFRLLTGGTGQAEPPGRA
jgi:hypothetical protein